MEVPGRKKRGVPNPWSVPSRGIFCGFPSGRILLAIRHLRAASVRETNDLDPLRRTPEEYAPAIAASAKIND
jgi:hypothetical protein